MAEDDSSSMANPGPEDAAKQQQQNCIFCHIVSGKVQSKKVYEDEETIGILDINPANPGHVLLLPKKHYAIMPQMNDFEIGHLFMVTKSLSGALLKALKADGTNIFVANGAVAGQKAPHFMAHVIPRKEGDKLSLNIPEHKISIAELLKIRDMLLPRIKVHLGLTDADIESMVAETAALKQVAAKAPPSAVQPEKMQKSAEVTQTQNIDQAKVFSEQIPLQEHNAKSNMSNEEIDLDAISSIINPRKNIGARLTSKNEMPLTEEQRQRDEQNNKEEITEEKKDRQRKITLSEIEGLFKHKKN
jgi:histidine triad (HIT) family protein